jgi:two-component system sensor histidine kinase UhpB
VPLLDWRELRRWGISDERVPAGGVILFKEFSAWEQYRPYILGALVLILLQTALIAGLVVQGLKRRRVEHELRASSDQNRDLAGRLINAQEVERARIARDLHDDHSQQLAGLAIMISGLKRQVGPGADPGVAATFITLQERTVALAESIRTLSHQLHPSVMHHSGLVASLQRLSQEMQGRHAIAMTFDAPDTIGRLNPEVALCLFRVAQEALTNVARHADARSVRVQLAQGSGWIELSVIDDGVGFIASQRKGVGLGLRSVDERVRLVGGTVRLVAQPGGGTTLTARIPIETA